MSTKAKKRSASGKAPITFALQLLDDKEAAAPRKSKMPSKKIKNHAARRCTSTECPVYIQPSDDYMLDHWLHANTARFTGGISPASLALAGIDWSIHLFSSPAKLQQLNESLYQKAVAFNQYAMDHEAQVLPPIMPESGDYRFTNKNWQKWPFNLYEQAFLLSQLWWKEATTNVRGVSPHHINVTSFMARQMLDIVAPSNHPFTNPDVIETTVNEGGANFLQGALNWYEDVMRVVHEQPPVGAEAFQVGKNIAVTPGKVVFCNPLMELIQYAPTTEQTYAEPVLIVPAWIMKYYILDLSPQNSLVKYLVDKGHTVFIISWKNPNACDHDIGFEDYLHTGLEEALRAVQAITRQPQVHAVGYCLGGTLLSMLAATLARANDTSLKTITLLAAQVDFEEAGEIMLFVDESQIAYLEDVMWNQGFLDKFQMAGAFQMLRSNDLIWSRIITNYLQGKRQPMNDLMAWNADATRMPYRMHSEYMRQLFMGNNLAEGHFVVNGAPIALQDITTPIFSVGTVRDHIAPWKSVYKILLLASGDVTFVLTSGGHNAGIVSEPGHEGRSYQLADIPADARYTPPDQWQASTTKHQGSWWDAWQPWLAGHSSGMRKPPSMGNKAAGFAPGIDAPGSYVLMQ